ncbi:OOP family OmpA-OmpF porin [Halospina denitrificans]|uniref:OOP family OmpA-OmpF porin n=1 Tax=Halospina denitrificans TaxID=332522 RepID=A0A4R7JYM2_9GAMM|nr:OmpA family protein [Halospina denitrificans]TDT43044.1 OOP family OmpA-OmpF porin [Halospina denitrificans]
MLQDRMRHLALVTLLIAPGMALADGDWDQWSASAMVEYVKADDDRFDIDDGAGMRFAAGHPITESLVAEVAVFGNSLDRDERSGKDWQYNLGVDALYRLREGTVTPYVIGGVGGMYNDYAVGTDTAPYANAGLGVEIPVWKNRLSLRAEARYAVDWADDLGGNAPYGDNRFFVGVSIPLFGEPEPPEPVMHTKVVERERVVKEIPDMQPLDGVTFEFDSATLTPNARVVLMRVARDLEYHSDVTVQIRGHTDSIGTAEYNRKLSQDRADSVKDFLVSQGIAEERITTKGFGFSKPVATNDTEEGRRLNRRIEMKRTDKGQDNE